MLDIEELPAILHAEDEPGEFEPGRSTEPAIVRKGYGDVDSAFRAAHAVVAATLSIGRHSGVPLETRGAIARYDAARDMLELHGAAKVPHWNRDQIARMLGRPAVVGSPLRGACRRRLRHSRRDLSGGRAGMRRGDAPAAAGQVDRGSPRASDCRQSFAPAAASRARRGRSATAAFSRSTTRSSTIRAPTCAPMRRRSPIWPRRCCRALIAFRLIAHDAHIRLTNKTPCGTYRAPGRFESTFVRERLMDAIAAQARPRPDRGAAPQSDRQR